MHMKALAPERDIHLEKCARIAVQGGKPLSVIRARTRLAGVWAAVRHPRTDATRWCVGLPRATPSTNAKATMWHKTGNHANMRAMTKAETRTATRQRQTTTERPYSKRCPSPAKESVE